MKHEITRLRHEIVRRSLTVQRREYVTPNMLRLTLGGEALKGFASGAPDDHIKVFAPDDHGDTARRDYTPRRYDAIANELAIDFALHDGGPVTSWARDAKPGDAVDIAGPRGSAVIPCDFDWWLLIGDETALPAIGRRIEELPEGTAVTSIVAISGNEEEQRITIKARHQAIWVHRPASETDDATALLSALKQFTPPPGEGFVWIAAEGTVARALKRFAAEAMNHPAQWMKASGYWAKGKADAAERIGE